MNKWIETYMEEKNLKPNELFKLQSEKYLDEYCFDDTGILRRKKNDHLEMASAEILGRLMRGINIEKVKPKGRYIPKLLDTYYYVSDLGNILGTTNNEDESDSYIFEHNLVFRTEEEAEDYRWFLEQVDKYKKEFVIEEQNHYFYYTLINKRIGISWNDDFKEHKFYFGSTENIEEFRNIVGDERIKKYFFNQY